MSIETKLQKMGLVLPEPIKVPAGVKLPFRFVRVHGNRAFISGHGPQNPDGSIAGPFGKVGSDISIEQGYEAAKRTALSILGSLDDITWLRVFGMVNASPDFTSQPQVINGFSDLILELYGPEHGAHARSAVGMAGLPFAMPVEIEAEIQIG